MPKKRKDADKLREDANETAFRVLQEAVGERSKTVPPGKRSDTDKSPEAVKRGRKGGTKGGKARAESLSDRRKSEIASQAAIRRWQEKR